jgi:hypothetical protein
MQRSDRLILLLALLAFAVWRLVRYMRLGMGKRRPSLGIAGGWVPPPSEAESLISNSDFFAAYVCGASRESDDLAVRPIKARFRELSVERRK